jgi:tetratricopeptide (TPR) repeat protein
MQGRATGVCVLAWLVMGVAAPADAQPALAQPSSQGDRPWAAGVSDAEQAAALELYVAGNREFTESRFAQALARYREAIRHWDHPAIRYNLAVCLINLDQPLEARDHLERSLRYGDAALGADAYQQAVTYRKLLDGQLARVRVTCREPGAEVTLDGVALFTAPGAQERFAMPGRHQVIAIKPGFLTASATLVLVAGQRTSHELQPIRVAATRTRMARRWAVWKPWAVLLGGGAVLGAGALSYAAAAHNLDRYDRGIELRCPTGCDAATRAGFTDLSRAKDRAHTEEVAAFSLFAVSGAAVIAGVIGVVLNQPRVQIEPVVSATGASVAVRWGF